VAVASEQRRWWFLRSLVIFADGFWPKPTTSIKQNLNVGGNNLAVIKQSIRGNAVSQHSLDSSGKKCRYKTHGGSQRYADGQIAKTTTAVIFQAYSIKLSHRSQTI
jgi:hypothetical protein